MNVHEVELNMNDFVDADAINCVWFSNKNYQIRLLIDHCSLRSPQCKLGLPQTVLVYFVRLTKQQQYLLCHFSD